MSSKHKTYLKMCEDLAVESKCSKHKVGALLVKRGRIVSNGVNGTHSGYINCCDHFHGVDVHAEPGRTEHRVWSEIHEIHAEMNAILFATREGVKLDGASLYCNLEPCFNCLKHAITAGITHIYYAKKHKSNIDTEEAKNLINTLNIKITHIEI